jgi:hypothetical protein
VADSSPALIAAAEDAGGYERLVCADAAELPFEDGCFDLADAGFVIEQLREPQSVDREPPDPLAPAGRKPYFLHLRCRLERPAGPLPSQLR